MSTKNIVSGLTADGDTTAVQVQAGQYMIARNGAFGGGTLQVKANIGACAAVPITGAAYTDAGAEVIWLPTCTVFCTLSGATAPNVNVAIAELSTKLDD